MPYHGGPSQCRIKVHLRLRPSSRHSPAIHIDEETATVQIDVQKHTGGGGPLRSHNDQIVFSFDSIIQTTNQETVYETCARQIVEDVLAGYNGTIMAYGQVGSGKTFTMTGDMKVYAHRGILPRAVHRIFAEKEAKPEAGIVVHMSYLQVYQEGIYDLLQQKGEPGGSLMILEENGSVDIRGLAKIRVENEIETLKLFFEGEKLRSYAHHTLNLLSSRSHCVLTLYIERKVGIRSLQDITAAKLNLVDLAGTERLKKMSTETGGQLSREACCINKSLSFLEQVMYALRLGQEYIPFRQSRITTLLKESLGGNCKTILMVCAWPEDYFLDETIGTFRFAQRVKFLRNFSILTKKMDCAANERRYMREIANLKQELALKDALNGRPGISYDDLKEDVKAELRKRIQAFFENEEELDRIPIENLKQVKELFGLFKEAQLSLRAELERVLLEHAPVPPAQEPPPEDSGVGELSRYGFHVGIAPPDARPENPSPSHCLSPDVKRCGVNMLDYKETHMREGVWECESKVRNDAFVGFKQSTKIGREQDIKLEQKQEELRSRRRYARDMCQFVNETKEEIENIKSMLEKDCSSDFNSELDSTKTNILSRYKAAKASYHRAFNEVKMVKTQLKKLQQEVRDLKVQLLESFYHWFDTKDKYRGKDTEAFLASVQ